MYSQKRSICFNVKEKNKDTTSTQWHYSVCNATYIREAGGILSEKVKDHSGRDCKLNILKHSAEERHDASNLVIFRFISNKY